MESCGFLECRGLSLESGRFNKKVCFKFHPKPRHHLSLQDLFPATVPVWMCQAAKHAWMQMPSVGLSSNRWWKWCPWWKKHNVVRYLGACINEVLFAVCLGQKKSCFFEVLSGIQKGNGTSSGQEDCNCPPDCTRTNMDLQHSSQIFDPTEFCQRFAHHDLKVNTAQLQYEKS